MSARKDSNGNAKLSLKGRKWLIIAYSATAAIAVAGAILWACGVTAGSTVIGVAFWIALFAFLIGREQKKKQEAAHNTRLGMINLPMAASEYLGKDYRAIVAVYERLGFRNITAVNLHDLHRVVLNKPGTVESVTIGGRKTGVNEWHDPDAEVVITYHGFAE